MCYLKLPSSAWFRDEVLELFDAVGLQGKRVRWDGVAVRIWKGFFIDLQFFSYSIYFLSYSSLVILYILKYILYVYVFIMLLDLSAVTLLLSPQESICVAHCALKYHLSGILILLNF